MNFFVRISQTNSWSFESQTLFERSFSAGVLSSEQNRWVTGGIGNGGDVNSEIYNETTKTFQMGADLPSDLYYHNLVAANATHYMLMGGNVDSDTVHLYNRYER